MPVGDGLKTDQTCRFEIQLPWKLDGSSIQYRLVGCRSGSRVGQPGLEGSWPQFEEERNAGADSERKRPHGNGKSVDFSPATFSGFRNDADKCPSDGPLKPLSAGSKRVGLMGGPTMALRSRVKGRRHLPICSTFRPTRDPFSVARPSTRGRVGRGRIPVA